MTEKTILLIATFDTKEDEALFLKKCIEEQGCRVLTLDAGILDSPTRTKPDINREEVALKGGMSLEDILRTKDKGVCILDMIRGAEAVAGELYRQGRIHAAVSIGGAQGTDIGCSAMRALPIGMPKLMVSTVASGRATFGPYVGTKDITMMHSVADMQGLNFLTKRIMRNAAGAVCGMLKSTADDTMASEGIPVAMSMLGTTTPGALRCKSFLEKRGFEIVTYHQNGTGGIAMEDMIRAGLFKGVLDLNLHEIGDRFIGGLHGSIREDRLVAAGELGIPQVVAPGSINYVVLGPLDSLTPEMRSRKLIVHNPNLTLVRLSPDELTEVGRIVAGRLNRAKGPTAVFIPLRGFSYPDRENMPHWEPEGNKAFIDALKADIDPTIPLREVDAHINDPDFIDLVLEHFLAVMKEQDAADAAKRRKS